MTKERIIGLLEHLSENAATVNPVEAVQLLRNCRPQTDEEKDAIGSIPPVVFNILFGVIDPNSPENTSSVCSFLKILMFKEAKGEHLNSIYVSQNEEFWSRVELLLQTKQCRADILPVLDAICHSDKKAAQNVILRTNIVNFLISSCLESEMDAGSIEAAAGALHGICRAQLSSVPEDTQNLLLSTFRSVIQNSLLNTDESSGGTQKKFEAAAVQAALGMAFLVGKDEQSWLSNHPEVIHLLVSVLDVSLHGERFAGHVWGTAGIVRPLEKICLSDQNKSLLGENNKFIDLNLISLCCALPPSDDIQKFLAKLDAGKLHPTGSVPLQSTLGIIVSMLFLKSSVDRVKELEAGFLFRAACDNPSSSPESIKLAQQALWMITEHSEEREEDVSTNVGNQNDTSLSGSHVMVSYNWTHQHVVKQLVSKLKEQTPVWFDIEQMSGSTIEAMANAVESSHTVVICVSSHYKESANCRLEAEYAQQLKKKIVFVMMENNYKPNGWLGILLGSKLWYPLWDDSNFDLNASKIVHEVGTGGAKTSTASIASATTTTVTTTTKVLKSAGSISSINSAQTTSGTITQKETGFTTWDQNQVSDWLYSFGFQSYSNSFKTQKINGKGLFELHLLLQNNPVAFYTILETKLNVSVFGDALLFGYQLRVLSQKK